MTEGGNSCMAVKKLEVLKKNEGFTHDACVRSRGEKEFQAGTSPSQGGQKTKNDVDQRLQRAGTKSPNDEDENRD